MNHLRTSKNYELTIIPTTNQELSSQQLPSSHQQLPPSSQQQLPPSSQQTLDHNPAPSNIPLCHQVTPFPAPIGLGSNTQFNWNYESRITRDDCAVNTSQKESQASGNYHLSGFDPNCHSPAQYADRMNEIMHFQKVYRNANCGVAHENVLIYPLLSNYRDINQLDSFHHIAYRGPGVPSAVNKDLESVLQQGVLTNTKQKTTTINSEQPMRYQYLHSCGHPQRIDHIIPPPVDLGGWIRGGDHTRDHVRQVNGYNKYLNKINKGCIHKSQ